jgi:hypothetical protein
MMERVWGIEKAPAINRGFLMHMPAIYSGLKY